MMNITIAKLNIFIEDLLMKSGINRVDAEIVANVYIRATLRGVGHHDIHDLHKRLILLAEGKVNASPNIQLANKFAALEGYEGDNGLGELCSRHIMKRAVSLAGEYGIGLCTVKHSNHFLAAAPHTEWAVEQGFIGIIFTRDKPTMNAPGTRTNVIGNNPFGFAAAQDQPYPLMLDVAMAYASIGKLNQMNRNNERIPLHWGKNAAGLATDLPDEVLHGGTVNPMGQHKGFGLALLNEILTGVLSGGQVIDEQHPTAGELGIYSQTAIAIKSDGLLPADLFRERVSHAIERIGELGGNVRIPGQRSWERKNRIDKEGVHLSSELVDILNHWATKLNVPCL